MPQLHRFAFTLLLLHLFAPVGSQDDASGLPPLFDRELFFGDPELADAQISPDGEFIAFLKPTRAHATSG